MTSGYSGGDVINVLDKNIFCGAMEPKTSTGEIQERIIVNVFASVKNALLINKGKKWGCR